MLKNWGCNYINGKYISGVAVISLISNLWGSSLVAQPSDVDPATIENPVVASEASIRAGANLFSRACATCHGLDAKGGEFETEITEPGPNPPDLTDSHWDYGSTEGQIYWNIAYGIYPYMDKYGDTYQDEQIWNIINYLRSINTSD